MRTQRVPDRPRRVASAGIDFAPSTTAMAGTSSTRSIRAISRRAGHLRPTGVESSTIALLLALGVVAAAAPAPAAAPPPCPDVRFLVDEPLVPGTALAFDAIVVDADGNASIASGCAPARARVSRRGTTGTIRVRWKACGELRSVRLTAKMDEVECATLTGTLTARSAKRRSFAGEASACGDGRLDPDGGEQCESAENCGGTTCTGCACGTGSSSTSSTSTTTSTTRTTTPVAPTTSTRPPTTRQSTSTSSSTTTSTTRQSTTTTTATPPTTIAGGLFEAPNAWTVDVSTLPKSGTSDGIIQALSAAGGWGTGTFRIDFSIEVLEANASTPFRTFTTTGDFYSPDCDHVPFPVPPGGALEGESGYECTSDGDCHLIVVHRPTKRLYEMWRANFVGPTFFGGCAAVWDLTRSHPATLRGDQCTSADAGGFPIAAMLFSADEVARGSIDHAIRFILPNSRMRSGVYVRPATHAGGPSGGSGLPPYGVRFRLRSDFPLASLPSEGARVVARSLQRYGMILSDGGNIALTAQSDRFTTHKWSQVGIDTRSLQAIQVTDMEVVGMGTPIPLTYECVRNP
jgi:serine/threonine-protein kinase